MTGGGAPSRVVLATRNEGKRRELDALLAPLGAEVLTLADAGVAVSAAEAELERFDTFEENALAKGRYFFARTGLATIADDSGLVVDALGGQPGVRSKRWSGRTDLEGRALDTANNHALLHALQGVEARSARFVCVAAYLDDSRELTRRGEIDGRLLVKPQGDHGFGYDPLFFATELGRTLAEAGESEKGRVSHRGRALRALWAALGVRVEDAAGH